MREIAQADYSSTHKSNCQKSTQMLFKWTAHERMEAVIGDLLTLAKINETIDAIKQFALVDLAKEA